MIIGIIAAAFIKLVIEFLRVPEVMQEAWRKSISTNLNFIATPFITLLIYSIAYRFTNQQKTYKGIYRTHDCTLYGYGLGWLLNLKVYKSEISIRVEVESAFYDFDYTYSVYRLHKYVFIKRNKIFKKFVLFSLTFTILEQKNIKEKNKYFVLCFVQSDIRNENGLFVNCRKTRDY